MNSYNLVGSVTASSPVSGSCGVGDTDWGRLQGGDSSSSPNCWLLCCCCYWSSRSSCYRSCSNSPSCSCCRVSRSRSSSSFFLYSSTEWSPMGQGVRFMVGEASTSSSMGRASFEGPSPPDPSLIMIGSSSTPEWGGSGAPCCTCGRGASIRFGEGGADSPTNGRGRAPSTPVDGRGSEEPVSTQRQKVSRHDN